MEYILQTDNLSKVRDKDGFKPCKHPCAERFYLWIGGEKRSRKNHVDAYHLRLDAAKLGKLHVVRKVK